MISLAEQFDKEPWLSSKNPIAIAFAYVLACVPCVINVIYLKATIIPASLIAGN